MRSADRDEEVVVAFDLIDGQAFDPELIRVMFLCAIELSLAFSFSIPGKQMTEIEAEYNAAKDEFEQAEAALARSKRRLRLATDAMNREFRKLESNARVAAMASSRYRSRAPSNDDFVFLAKRGNLTKPSLPGVPSLSLRRQPELDHAADPSWPARLSCLTGWNCGSGLRR